MLEVDDELVLVVLPLFVRRDAAAAVVVRVVLVAEGVADVAAHPVEQREVYLRVELMPIVLEVVAIGGDRVVVVELIADAHVAVGGAEQDVLAKAAGIVDRIAIGIEHVVEVV
jgi:hypothetical protein